MYHVPYFLIPSYLMTVSYSWIPEISFLVSMLVAVVSPALSFFLLLLLEVCCVKNNASIPLHKLGDTERCNYHIIIDGSGLVRETSGGQRSSDNSSGPMEGTSRTSARELSGPALLCSTALRRR